MDSTTHRVHTLKHQSDNREPDMTYMTIHFGADGSCQPAAIPCLGKKKGKRCECSSSPSSSFQVLDDLLVVSTERGRAAAWKRQRASELHRVGHDALRASNISEGPDGIVLRIVHNIVDVSDVVEPDVLLLEDGCPLSCSPFHEALGHLLYQQYAQLVIGLDPLSNSLCITPKRFHRPNVALRVQHLHHFVKVAIHLQTQQLNPSAVLALISVVGWRVKGGLRESAITTLAVHHVSHEQGVGGRDAHGPEAGAVDASLHKLPGTSPLSVIEGAEDTRHQVI
eukprot:UN0582